MVTCRPEICSEGGLMSAWILPIILSLFTQAAAERRIVDFQNIRQRDINQRQLTLSRDRELQLGREHRALLDQHVKLLSQPDVDAYISGVTQRLATNSD